MATTQTTSVLSADQPAAFYDRLLLKRLVPHLVHSRFGQKRELPLNNGKTINVRRFESLNPATTPLTEGTVPAGNSLTITAITATISEYGDFVQVSDLTDLTSLDPVLSETAELLGEQAGVTLDTVIRDAIVTGTTVQYAGGVAGRVNVAAANVMTSTEIRKAKRTLSNNNAKPLPDGSYIGIASPYTAYDIQGDTGWQNPNLYVAAAGGESNIFTGEIGRLYSVRFVETSNAKKFVGAGAAGIDVHGTLIMGIDAYAVVDLESAGAVRNIVKPLGSGGASDPLNQIATSGWKAIFTAKIIQDNAICRVEHAVTP